LSTLWIRAVYAALLALVVALTVGFGVSMAFPGPRPPDTPQLTFRQLQGGSDDQQNADELINVVDRFYQDAYDFRRAYPAYQRNILVIMVLLAVLAGAAGLALPDSFNYLRLGLTLGALLVLIYGAAVALGPTPNPAPTASPSVTNLLAAGSPPGLDFAGRFLRFAASFVALLVFLFLGLWRLTDWAPRAQPRDSAGSGAALAQASPGVTAGLDRPSGELQGWRRPDAD
jgi:hypothetical protein